ncbi:MAG: HAD family hydrolase [Deltaproteobacteria bacterium]|jgi:phosphoglycolate phosphatase|nr:HAD family hydrolase [Deltaproteobacteria bacterium]
MTGKRISLTKAVIFDFDMTLVDSSYSIVNAINLFAEEKGLRKITREELLNVIGLTLEESWVQYWGQYDFGWPELYREKYKEVEISGFKLFEDTLSTLDTIRCNGMKTAVVTNRWMAKLAVDQSGLGYLVDAVVGADEVSKKKPDPEPVLHALSLLGVEAQEAVYVGDTAIDIMAAKGANVDCIGVATGALGIKELLGCGANWACKALSCVLSILSLKKAT